MTKNLIPIGWREWAKLPELSNSIIKAKIDTGACTSSLHALQPTIFREQGKLKVRFIIQPKQKSAKKIVCVANMLDYRWITDSGGHREHRYVIETEIILGSMKHIIELTLTSRSDMRFRMLLGRKALKDIFMVDPSASYLLGKPL